MTLFFSSCASKFDDESISGDIGYVDEYRNLFIVDRLKELIKVKGLQVRLVRI